MATTRRCSLKANSGVKCCSEVHSIHRHPQGEPNIRGTRILYYKVVDHQDSTGEGDKERVLTSHICCRMVAATIGFLMMNGESFVTWVLWDYCHISMLQLERVG